MLNVEKDGRTLKLTGDINLDVTIGYRGDSNIRSAQTLDKIVIPLIETLLGGEGASDKVANRVAHELLNSHLKFAVGKYGIRGVLNELAKICEDNTIHLIPLDKEGEYLSASERKIVASNLRKDMF